MALVVYVAMPLVVYVVYAAISCMLVSSMPLPIRIATKAAVRA